MSPPALTVVSQWNRLVEQDGVLFRRVFRPDGAEAVFQLLLPAVLKQEVLAQVHQGHGHQGVERMLELLQERYYWPSEVA